MKRIRNFAVLCGALCGLLLTSCCNNCQPAFEPIESSVVYEMNVRQQSQEGTFAAAMPNQVEDEVKLRRAEIIMDIQRVVFFVMNHMDNYSIIHKVLPEI